MKPKLIAILLPVLMSTVLSGCGSASTGIGSEVAASTTSGVASSTEGSVALFDGAKIQKNYFQKLKEKIDVLPQAIAATACSTIISAASCSGSTLTYAFGSTGNGCTAGSAGLATFTGNMFFTFTSGSCVNPITTAPGAGAVFTRTTDATGINRTVGSYSVTSTTTDTSGYDRALSGGTTITCDATNGCGSSGSRTVAINGIHLKGSSVFGSWDHTVSTDTSLRISGTGSSRTISSGVVRVQHNLAKFTSISTITSTLTFSANCCFPTGGAISTSFSSGSNSGQTETMTFTSTCGTATLVDSSGKSSSVTLSHCMG